MLYIIGLYFQRHKVLYGILLFTLLFLVGSSFLIQHVDLLDFDYGWVQWMKEYGLFRVYHMCDECVDRTCSSINYPPLYPAFLYLISGFVGDMHSYSAQFFIKLFPAVLFMVSQIWVYFKISERAAVIWTFSLPFILNALCWGQRDIAFIFFMIVMFYNIEEDKPYGAAIWFTLACLLKPQGVLLLPILLLYLFISRAKVKHKILSLLSGAGIGVLTFLPFMIAEKSIFTFFTPYFYCGAGARINGMAPNIWFLFQGFIQDDQAGIVSMLFYFMFIISICIFIFYYYKTKNFMLSVTVYMFTYFMFNVGQTERYSLYVVVCFFYMLYISKNRFSYNRDLIKSIYVKCYWSSFIAQLSKILFTNLIMFSYIRFGYFEKFGCLVLHQKSLENNAVLDALIQDQKFSSLSNEFSLMSFVTLFVAVVLMIVAYYKFVKYAFDECFKLDCSNQIIKNN